MNKFIQILFFIGIILFLYMGVDIFCHLLRGEQVSKTGTWNTNWVTFGISIYLFLTCAYCFYILQTRKDE